MRALWKTAVYSLAALGLLVVLVTATPFVWWYAGKLSGPPSDDRGDILIVLGADTMDWRSDRILGLTSYLRCLGALYTYRQGHFRQIVISGAGVAAPMRDFLVSQGVPAGVIRLETGSHSTRENALFTARLLAGDSAPKVLLTSEYHMWRSYRAFRRAGLETRAWPVPDARKGGWPRRWPAFLDEAVETAKIGYYALRGWI